MGLDEEESRRVSRGDMMTGHSMTGTRDRRRQRERDYRMSIALPEAVDQDDCGPLVDVAA